jgi:hypothetical protein
VDNVRKTDHRKNKKYYLKIFFCLEYSSTISKNNLKQLKRQFAATFLAITSRGRNRIGFRNLDSRQG